jgi:R67 dihydrofolate reductase
MYDAGNGETVTRAETIKFLNLAIRNWQVQALSDDDVNDVAMALSRFLKDRCPTPLSTECGQVIGDYPDDPHSLKQMLHQRDKWIVESGNWQAFANALGAPHVAVTEAISCRDKLLPSRTFALGDMVRKRTGSWWEGRVVGFYSTAQTPDGVCVQLEKPQGPVQIYPAKTMELVP